MGESTTSQRRIEAAKRRARALEMRAEGQSFRAIAEQLGFAGPAGAFRTVEKAMSALVEEPAKQVLQVELDRLDRATELAMAMISAGKSTGIDQLLKIQERRSRLLGLDQPERKDVTSDNKPLDSGQVMRIFVHGEEQGEEGE